MIFYVVAPSINSCRSQRNCSCRPRCISEKQSYLTLRDDLGTFYKDEDFAALFPTRGQRTPGFFAVAIGFDHGHAILGSRIRSPLSDF